MAKRKKVKKKQGRMRRWSQNAVPLKGSGPNANVIAEYKERTKTLGILFEDHGPPTKVMEKWKGSRHHGVREWHRMATEVPGVWRYFYANEHFLVKVHPATGKMKRSSIQTNPTALLLNLLRGRIAFTEEFDPNGLESLHNPRVSET